MRFNGYGLVEADRKLLLSPSWHIQAESSLRTPQDFVIPSMSSVLNQPTYFQKHQQGFVALCAVKASMIAASGSTHLTTGR